MLDNNANDSSASMAKKSKEWLKKHNVKSPSVKKHYSPDNGKTIFPYKNKEQLNKLKLKYPKS